LTRVPLSLLRRVESERGLSIIELLTAMSIMGVVLSGLTTIFVSGSKAEFDMNQRFQAQSAGRLALDKIRKEIHCASTASSTGSTVTLTMPSGCKTASNTTVTWCTSQVGSSATRFALYRYQGSGTCTAGVQWADYLTQASAFAFTQQSTSGLAMVHVYLPVNLTPGKKRTYALQDDIYLRNSSRTCISGSPSPPCP
jgi:prepilin-type N-terminal cleavage/methylation domain-containing protein